MEPFGAIDIRVFSLDPACYDTTPKIWNVSDDYMTPTIGRNKNKMG